MCVPFPGRIVEIADGLAVIETEGQRRRASLILVPEARAGDWVIVATGTILEVLDPEEARQIREMLDAAARDEDAAPPAAPPVDREPPQEVPVRG